MVGKRIRRKDAFWWAGTREFWHLGGLDSDCMNIRLEPDLPFEGNSQLFPEAADGYFRQTITPPELDYRRVVSSLPVRGLKDKTQVFPLDQEYFVRTRFSHSLEVMTNADMILAGVLASAKDEAKKEKRVSEFANLVKAGDIAWLDRVDEEWLRYSLRACCLLHDAGNPPFGHFGEQVIRKWFSDKAKGEDALGRAVSSIKFIRDLTGFEGNANSMRIALRHCGLYDGRRMNLTGTTLAALVKYPWYSSECGDAASAKYSFFESDRDELAKLEKLAGVPRLSKGERHPLSLIMEAADDISYAVGDFEDAFRKGKFTVSEAITYMLGELEQASLDESLRDACKQTYALIFMLAVLAGDKGDLERCISTCEAITERICEKGYKYELDYYVNPEKKAKTAYAHLCPGGNLAHLEHTFLAALADNPIPDVAQRRQLQETYVVRWTDIARKWLCFSSAKSLCESEIKAFSGEDVALNKSVVKAGGAADAGVNGDSGECEAGKSDSNLKMDKILFGTHWLTVKIAKGMMPEFVYEADENLKLNMRAHAVLGGLLDMFIPAAFACASEDGEHDPIDMVTLKGAHGSDKALMRIVPLRHRLDYKHRYERGQWAPERERYELALMVLDFLSSLTDEGAVQLYKSIR